MDSRDTLIFNVTTNLYRLTDQHLQKRKMEKNSSVLNSVLKAIYNVKNG